MNYPRVLLIGGAPMSGKTSVARLLASKLNYCCLSTDDLGEAVRAVTNVATDPRFHLMDGYDYREYYIARSLDELIEDIRLGHEALWPAVEAVIRKHSTWAEPVVIEGWALWPERVSKILFKDVAALWLIPGEETLRDRIINSVDFYGGASDEKSMIRKYLERSFWYNSHLKETIERLDLDAIYLPDDATLDEIISLCLEKLKSK